MDDFEEPRVTIRSESGNWQVEGVLARNDPVFRNLGMMHKNGVVTFDAELSRVFEEGWPHYLRLKEWIEEVKQSRKGRVQGIQPMWMRDSLRGERSVEKMKTSLVYLHQIEGLLKFIAMPEGYEVSIGVSEESTPQQRKRHIILMGARMMDRKLDEDVGALAKPSKNSGIALQFLFYLLGRLEREKDKRPLAVYWGLMRNSLLRTIEEYPGKRIAWPTVLWGDIPTLLSNFSIKDEEILSFSRMMNDERGTSDLSTRIHLHWKVVGNKSTLDEVEGVKLYERFLESYPENEKPSVIGLMPKYHSMYSQLDGGIVGSLVHNTHTALLRREGEDANEWARRFSSSVGNQGTTRALLSLLHQLDREEGDETTEEMASALENVLEEGVENPTELIVINV